MILSLASLPVSYAAEKEPAYLGITQAQWEEALKPYETIRNHQAFYDTMKDTAKELRAKSDSQHYETLDKDRSLREIHNNNPLLQMKPKKQGNHYLANLNLENSDFHNAVSLIRILAEGYDETAIASLMPYIAYCINENIGLQDIRYYCYWFVHNQTPVDIAQERFYRLVNNTNEFDRDLWKH